MILTNKKGEELTTDLSEEDAVTFAGSSDSSFARDLAYKVKRRIVLTPEQRFYLHKLALESKASQMNAVEQYDSGSTDKAKLLAERFRKAGDGKDFSPSLTFVLNEGVLQLKLVRTGVNAGSVWITDGGGYGRNRLYGCINPSGLLKFFLRVDWVEDAVKSLIEDPDEYCLSLATLTGACPVCGKSCADLHPVCASLFGLSE